MKDLILRCALSNAQEHEGKANAQAVLGKIISEDPSIKSRIKEVMPEIEKIVREVNSWTPEQQLKKLEAMGGFEKKVKEEEKGLPSLANAIVGKVVMRMAPNPNGPLHIGHARMVILNDEYAKKYDGTLILRFDDTDPKNPNKIPMKQAYKWIEEDLKWLEVKYDKVERASARLKTYYKYFEEFLKKGFAYVCTCDAEEWSRNVRTKRIACPCRGIKEKENLARWKKVISGKFKEGQAVGRIKTSVEADDPALIDWVAFRIVNKPEHPFVQKKFKVWPTLDFASAIDDFEFGITHIVRGKDLAISEKRQRFIYANMGWKYPETRVYGKFMTTEDLVISKSKIADGIKKGDYTGYDDPRLALLRSYRRRGILPIWF